MENAISDKENEKKIGKQKLEQNRKQQKNKKNIGLTLYFPYIPPISYFGPISVFLLFSYGFLCDSLVCH